MAFTKKSKNAPKSASKRGAARPAAKSSGLARIPTTLVVRTLLLGVAAIAGAAWGLVRHCTHEEPPLLRTTSPSQNPEADAGEIPAPELLGPPATD